LDVIVGITANRIMKTITTPNTGISDTKIYEISGCEEHKQHENFISNTAHISNKLSMIT
jgi:hypothetical protein